MGAWIETRVKLLKRIPTRVAPFMGAWIETVFSEETVTANGKLLPLWEHGLKPSSML